MVTGLRHSKVKHKAQSQVKPELLFGSASVTEVLVRALSCHQILIPQMVWMEAAGAFTQRPMQTLLAATLCADKDSVLAILCLCLKAVWAF